jgi:hypothetical protein
VSEKKITIAVKRRLPVFTYCRVPGREIKDTSLIKELYLS